MFLSIYSQNIKETLNLPHFNNPKYLNVLGPSIFLSTASYVDSICKMEEWDDEKFMRLLSSNIWKCPYEDIKKTLSLKEWEDPKFKKLLTSNIWKNRYETIVIKLNLPYWNKKEYTHLLVPSLFTLPINNIIYGIELFEENGIGEYVTNKALRHNLENLKKIFAYMKEHNFELLLSTKETKKLVLNPIFSMPNTELKKERVL